MNLEEQIAQINNPQEFTRLCNAILTAEYSGDFQVIDGTRSDEGNDGYIISEKRIIAMYCPIKPERKRDSDYLAKIKSDLIPEFCTQIASVSYVRQFFVMLPSYSHH